MALPDGLLQAAEHFGAELNALPAVQAYLAADAAVKNNPEVQAIKAEADRAYRSLMEQQRAGANFDPRYVSEYYRLRERLANHPLVQQREACLQAVKPIFEHMASAISSLLSVDYTSLVK